jgi:hypothetical protein
MEEREQGRTMGFGAFPSSILPSGQDTLHATREKHKNVIKKSPKISVLFLKFYYDTGTPCQEGQ